MPGPRETVTTDIGFISGKIFVHGFPKHNDLVVRIVAVSSESMSSVVTAEVTVNDSKAGVRYVLLVPPGKWRVHADIGSVSSKPNELAVSSGQEAVLDFVFGVPTPRKDTP